MSDEESHTVTSIDDDYRPELESSTTTSNANSDSNSTDAPGNVLKAGEASQPQPPQTSTSPPPSTFPSISASASASTSNTTETLPSNPLQSILSSSNGSKPPTGSDGAASKQSPPPQRVKNVKFADHPIEIIDSNNNISNDDDDSNLEGSEDDANDTHAETDHSLISKSAENGNSDTEATAAGEDKDTSPIQIVDDNEDINYDPRTSNLPPKPSTFIADRSSPIDDSKYSNINVPLFNEVVQYFITSPLFNDPNFNALSPADKESTLLKAYETATNRKVNPDEVNINFRATTSYNKFNMKPNDDRQLLVPINPFCRRPDLTLAMDSEEKHQFDEFKKEAEKHSKEFECLNFPPGSRLFVGNLAVNSLKISDVWRVFKRYGNVKAVNMKQGYGFVQFINAESCKKAIQGEEHVPLHNRLMHLEVSKTHEKHTENRTKDLNERDRERERERARGRERERSPKRNFNERQRSPQRSSKTASQNKKVRVIISLESEASFNHLLVNSLNEVGLECSIKHVDSTAEEVPQETISESAYAGVAAAIVTSKLELVNLFLFQRDTNDGAIKFDEYENISMESAINFILNQSKKDRNSDNNNSRNNSNNYRQEYKNGSNDRRRNQGKDGNSNNNNNNNNSRGDRNRNDRRRNNHNRDNRDGRDGRDNRERYPSRNQNYGNAIYHNNNDNINNLNNNSHPIGSLSNNGAPNFPRYSPRQQEAQKHLPPQVAGIGGNYTPNQIYQQVPPTNSQQFYGYNNQPPQQPYYPNPNHNQNVASQLMSQLSSLDEGSLKAMLNLVNQQQQQQQQRAAVSPHMPMGNSMYPSQPPNMSMQHQPPSGPIPNAGGVGGLLAQLQNMVPGTNVNNIAPATAAANNPNSYPNSNNQSSGNRESQQNGGEDASRLFETLARLKNNM